MSNVTYPNGNGTLISTAQTPLGLETIFQSVMAQMLGINPVANPQTAWTAVRVAWQIQGQPAWAITDDVCIVRATADDAPFSRVRDNLWAENDDVSVILDMQFTQVWTIHATLYGPNCYDHARQIISALSLDWVSGILEPLNLYLIPDWIRPSYVPELKDGQWWQRTDIEFKLNENALESMVIPTAAEQPVTLVPDVGSSEEFVIES